MRLSVVTVLLLATPLLAVDPPAKEPPYAGKPGYLLLKFGPEGKDRVWLVQDGDALYVDRNGNGDLTEAEEKVAAKLDSGARLFTIDELNIRGRSHRDLQVSLAPIEAFASSEAARLPAIKTLLDRDRKAEVAMIRIELDMPDMKGAGLDGRTRWMAGIHDLVGVLQFASRPGDAPEVHFGGPLTVTFFDSLPKLRVGSQADAYLVVGTRGRKPGSLAMLGYETSIPANAHAVLEVEYPAAKEGDPPVREHHELKQRC